MKMELKDDDGGDITISQRIDGRYDVTIKHGIGEEEDNLYGATLDSVLSLIGDKAGAEVRKRLAELKRV